MTKYQPNLSLPLTPIEDPTGAESVAVIQDVQNRQLVLRGPDIDARHVWQPPRGLYLPSDVNLAATAGRVALEQAGLMFEPTREVFRTLMRDGKPICFWIGRVVGNHLAIRNDQLSNFGWFVLEPDMVCDFEIRAFGEAVYEGLVPGVGKFIDG